MSITDTTVGEPRSAHDNRVAIAELSMAAGFTRSAHTLFEVQEYLRARTNALLGQNLNGAHI